MKETTMTMTSTFHDDTHEYPYGAIQTEAGLVTYGSFHRLYSVHGLREDSFLTVMENVRNLRTCAYGCRMIDYTDTTKPDDPWNSRYCLGDFNIGNTTTNTTSSICDNMQRHISSW